MSRRRCCSVCNRVMDSTGRVYERFGFLQLAALVLALVLALSFFSATTWFLPRSVDVGLQPGFLRYSSHGLVHGWIHRSKTCDIEKK